LFIARSRRTAVVHLAISEEYGQLTPSFAESVTSLTLTPTSTGVHPGLLRFRRTGTKEHPDVPHPVRDRGRGGQRAADLADRRRRAPVRAPPRLTRIAQHLVVAVAHQAPASFAE